MHIDSDKPLTRVSTRWEAASYRVIVIQIHIFDCRIDIASSPGQHRPLQAVCVFRIKDTTGLLDIMIWIWRSGAFKGRSWCFIIVVVFIFTAADKDRCIAAVAGRCESVSRRVRGRGGSCGCRGLFVQVALCDTTVWCNGWRRMEGCCNQYYHESKLLWYAVQFVSNYDSWQKWSGKIGIFKSLILDFFFWQRLLIVNK